MTQDFFINTITSLSLTFTQSVSLSLGEDDKQWRTPGSMPSDLQNAIMQTYASHDRNRLPLSLAACSHARFTILFSVGLKM